MEQLNIKNKNQIVIDFFKRIKIQKEIFTAYDRRNIIYYSNEIAKDIHLFKLAKETKRILHEEGDTDVTPLEESDYPFLYLIIDFERQIFLIQKNTSVFKDVSTVKNRIENLLKEKLENFDYRILFEEITNESVFWDYIDESSAIYELNLKLNSPNLFGGFIESEELLKKINSLFNNTSTDIKFKNEKGKLKVIKKNIQGFIKYITGGGGEWELRSNFSGRTRRIKSKDSIKTIVLPNTIEKAKEDKQNVIKEIKNIDDILGDEPSGKKDD